MMSNKFRFCESEGEHYMQAIQRIPVVQQVVDNMTEHITSGTLLVGDKLPSEASWCESLGVGRGTVREAIRILEARGLVEMRAGRGAFVARITKEDPNELLNWFKENEIEVKDVLEVRTAIEPVAVRLAIKRSTPEDVEKLKDILEQTKEAVTRNDVSAIAHLDEEFHNFIVLCSRNKLLLSINNQIVECLKSFRGKTFFIPENVQNLLGPHSKIVAAFEAHDGEAGARCMLEHLDWVKKDFQKSLEPTHTV
jgi:GntR family transcriptional repressor for pyruvate dehydrogenase complex